MKKSQYYAKHIRARISPKKVVPVMDLIRNRNLLDAKLALAFDQTKAAKMILKVLKSAEANIKTTSKADLSRLYVSETWVGSGPTFKSGRIVAKSRLSPIKKRTSHIYIGLSERDRK